MKRGFRQWMIQTGRTVVAAGLCAVIFLTAGCGSGDFSEKTGERPTASGSGTMGRYMETVCGMPEEINRNGGVSWLEDGSLAVISFGEGLYRSADEGQTWQKEETEWFPMLENVYCLSAVMGPDGTVAASCSGGMPEAVRAVYGKPVEEDWEGNYCVFAMPDGTVKIVDFGFSQEDGSCIQSFVFKEDGRLFAGDMTGRIYEIDAEKETLKELFVTDRAGGYMDFSQDTLMVVGHNRLYLYDLQEEVLLSQDVVADAFIQQVLKGGTVSYTSGGFPLAVAGSSEEDVVYIACMDGVYRHVLGGSVMEQVIDGALSTFGDAFSSIYRMKVLENQEFLVAFQPSAGLIRYTFDETIPSMPDQEIRIYSLEENDSVRRAMTVYRKAHIDTYVRYEVGLQEEDGITAEDALKKLNAQILSGDGPDVLILDGLPMDAYMEKGMLQDIRPLLDEMAGEDTLFANIVDGFTDAEGAVRAMPMCIQVPLLAGGQNMIRELEDLESIAEKEEELRDTHPQGGIFGIYDPEVLLRLFGMVSSPAWLTEDGKLDEQAVTDFLSLTKRIYDAEMSGAIPEQVEEQEKLAEEYASYGMDAVQEKLGVCNNVLEIPRGGSMLAVGYVESIQLCLNNVTSALRADESLDYRVFQGQVQNVFLPKTMVGISSRSEHPAEAEEFVRLMFGKDTQEDIYEGFPVNRAAYEAHFDVFEENADNGSMSLQMLDGAEQEFRLWWPDQEERRKFTECVEALETPVLTSSYLCEMVYETGVKVLEGEMSAEHGAKEIVKKASVYLSE